MNNLLKEKVLQIGPENVAAFIGEPTMGAIGVHIPPKTYWPEIKKICQKYDVLLVSDEVVCGFGRTGNWFGYDTFFFFLCLKGHSLSSCFLLLLVLLNISAVPSISTSFPKISI